MNRWLELADGVFARRHDELDLTTGLVVGGEQALVIDTRGDTVQGAELAAAVRTITTLPLAVVLTHAHFDHCFGTATFLPAPVYAHAGCHPALTATAMGQRAEWVAHYRGHGDHATADALAATEPVPPDRLVADAVQLELGGRTVTLRHTGRGHTDHDLAVHVPAVHVPPVHVSPVQVPAIQVPAGTAGVLFAGDLLENGAPPDFTDAYPLDWAPSLARLLDGCPAAVVVPGHGEPMTPHQARAQQEQLARVAELAEAVRRGGLTSAEAQARSPFPDVHWDQLAPGP